MANHADSTGAPARAPKDLLENASCLLECASGMADILAEHLEARRDDKAAVTTTYGLAHFADCARGDLAAAINALFAEGR